MTQQPPLSTPMPWDMVADAYTDEIVPVFELYARDALRLAAPPHGARIVDVACGPGTLTFAAAAEGFTVDAIDFSPKMIASLQARAANVEGITAQVGDGQALPYPAGTFAAAFSMFSLMFFPDRAKGFAELRRVLAPGGRAVVGSWARLEEVPLLALVFKCVRESIDEALGDAAPKGGGLPAALTTEDECFGEMSVEFSEVSVHRVEHPHVHASTDAFWESALRTSAPFALMAKGLGKQFAKVDKLVRARLRAALPPGPVTVLMPANLTVGTAR
jgi:SAM-dependent methyltransferase